MKYALAKLSVPPLFNVEYRYVLMFLPCNCEFSSYTDSKVMTIGETGGLTATAVVNIQGHKISLSLRTT